MNDRIFRQARTWGFICNSDAIGKLQILPQKITERWKLQLVEESWLLIVGDVPQILCHPTETLEFLERRCPRAKTFTEVSSQPHTPQSLTLSRVR